MSNLYKVERDLRSIAKRYKSIKYSVGLAILFLMLGVSAFSEEVESSEVNSVPTREEIASSRENLKSSVGSLQSKIDQARAENEKSLVGLKLELIQLMEQGDQVVKSPWASWQFGTTYIYSKWNDTYKGSGDKTEKYPFEGIFMRSNSLFEQAISPLSNKYKELPSTRNPYVASSNRRNGLGLGYGLASTEQKQEPLATLNVDASVRPKDVFRDPINAPTVTVQAPQLPPLNVPNLRPRAVNVPSPNVPNKTVNIVQPNASPFTGFFFDASANALHFNNSQGLVTGSATYTETKNVTLYSGVKGQDIKDNKAVNQITPAANTGYIKADGTIVDVSTSTNLGGLTSGNIIGRTTNILYRSGYDDGRDLTLSNLKLHVRGNFDGTTSGGVASSSAANDSYVDIGRGAAGGADPGSPVVPTRGTVGIHTLLNVKVKDTKATLYGRAGFLTSETWRSGTVTMENTTVDVYGEQNSVFYIMPSAYGTIAERLSRESATDKSHLKFYIGGLKGTTNINMYGKGNTAYLSTGISGPRHIENSGIINLDGASNIVYSNIGYTPDWSKTWYQNNTRYGAVTRNVYGDGSVAQNKMKSIVKLGTGSGSVNLYGDESVGIFFGSKMGGADPKSWEVDHRNVEFGTLQIIKKSSFIGIYQGEIELHAKIGERLSSTGSKYQTAEGNIYTLADSKEFVEGAVGVFSQSGQREGIRPIDDLGVPVGGYGGTAEYAHINELETKDKIHSLQIAKLDVRFGSKSRNGFMLISKLGTVMDIASPSADVNYIPNMTTEITDGVNGASTTEAQASIGTTIAYAEGTWDQTKHQLGSKLANLNKNNADAAAVNGGTARKPLTDMTASTAAKLQGLPSEINIYPNVILASKNGIAYMGDNKGIVNAKGTTKAVNYGAIIGFARNKGIVNITGAVTALDNNVVKANNKYKNIAGLATAGGTVNITGNVNINGIGGLASGNGSVVNLKGKANVINIGKDGGLAAVNQGKVNFAGGTINIGAGRPSSTPMYADSSSSIIFQDGATATAKPTQINMASGILMPGPATDYSATTTGTGKYKGMKNVKVKLVGDGVVLQTNNGRTLNWNGSTAGSNGVKTAMKLGELDTNGKKFKIYDINGTFNLNTNLNLDTTTDEFNSSLGLSNEVFNIASTVTISSTAGNGLSMGSNSSASSNATNVYNNNGKVNITGGARNRTSAINISYGTINNKNIVSVDKGIGLYGINGSKLINNNSGKISVTNTGVGMAGFTSANTLQEYGTDKKIKNGTLLSTDRTLELINKGTIAVNGANSVGMYGETAKITGAHSNTKVKASNGFITNEGKIVMTGKNAVGIVSKGLGNTINLKGTGSSDIELKGTKSIGVYAEKSNIRLLSNYGVEIKDDGTGIFVKDGSTISVGNLELKYSGSNTQRGTGIFYQGKAATTMTNKVNIRLVDTVGSKIGLIGIYTNNGGILANNGNILGNKGYGIVTHGTEIINNANITLNNPIASKNASVGIVTKASDKITNKGTISVGNDSVGIYGKAVDNINKITVGNAGTGIYSTTGNVNLISGSIQVGSNKAVGVYVQGKGQTVTANSGSNLIIGDNSFGFINSGSGNKINSNIGSQVLGTDATYIYSTDKTGLVTNNTALTSTGSYNYGLYSAGTVVNNRSINFNSGFGNVGIYSTYGGRATNNSNISVGKSYIDPNDVQNNRYSVGMAAGFSPNEIERRAGKTPYTGNIVNNGTINVTGEYSIGMYGTGAGTKVYNGTATNPNAVINLSASNTTGMYLDNGAVGYNYGTIKTVGTGLEKVVGIVVKNGSILENHGNIILNAKSAVGLLTKGNAVGNNLGIIKNYNSMQIQVSGDGAVKRQEDTNNSSFGKGLGDVSIDVPKGSTVGKIYVNGKIVVPEVQKASSEQYKEINVSKIGMYIDTSSKRFTKPIEGLSQLNSLTKADLIIGAEAAENTTAKQIQVNKKILKPYNAMIRKNPQINDWKIYSGSLTWIATISQNQTDGTIENAYMAKVNYTSWAGQVATPVDKKDTYNFLNGLEQRYGVDGIGTKENQLFQKINKIGNNEEILFFQAMDEMMGHQYANVQQRVQATGNILNQELANLKNDWKTASKDSNKLKIFGTNGEYKTDTAGVIDYKNNAYGVAYVHENEDIKLGRGIGFYSGIVHNTFKFKDIGKSKEEMLQAKVGMFKSVPFDDNNSLNWIISGDVFVGYNKMNRKFLVVDEVFNAKAKYHIYGIGVRNEIGKEFRLSEAFSLRPYAALGLEYGRIGKIREKSGEIKLEVKQNDYVSIKPEVGAELGFRHFFGAKSLRAGLGVAYENELGRVANGKNKARVADTTADWFNIRGEKEDRRGNVKFDLNLGLDNQRFGVTGNVGYDTKGENVRGGVGLRIIF